ncbi:kinesin-like protein KCA1 [Artemisia annua]|uniref:Kinesin-like protein KCA1 n=1 Tax=Artemisia annua TaxID=35608 RepID=A0A2U1MMW9_ARTAN|nr:kinesin-like protein KCA1 [Artemisia annua]
MGVNNIEAKIISGGKFGIVVVIPRMNISPSNNKMSFQMNIKQMGRNMFCLLSLTSVLLERMKYLLEYKMLFLRLYVKWSHRVIDTMIAFCVRILYIRSLLARSPELQCIKVSPVDIFLEKPTAGNDRSPAEAVNGHFEILWPVITNFGGRVKVLSIQDGEYVVMYTRPESIAWSQSSNEREVYRH